MTLSRVLLVDDHDEISAVFQEGLENYGFDVVIASSVRRALSLIAWLASSARGTGRRWIPSNADRTATHFPRRRS